MLTTPLAAQARPSLAPANLFHSSAKRAGLNSARPTPVAAHGDGLLVADHNGSHEHMKCHTHEKTPLTDLQRTLVEAGELEARRLVEPVLPHLSPPGPVVDAGPSHAAADGRRSRRKGAPEMLSDDSPLRPNNFLAFDPSTGLPHLNPLPLDSHTAAVVRPANRLCPLGQVPGLDHAADPHWIWPGRIRRGELTLLAGDICSGKSFVACDLIARLSSGRPLPDAPPDMPPAPPLEVLLVVGLESHPEVLHDRLHRLDADPSRVQVLRLVQEETAAHQSLVRNFAADRDLGLLTRHLQEHPGTQLVVLDSFDRLAGSRYSPAVIRQVLTRLQSIAATSGVAILITKSYAHTPRPGRHLRALGSTVFADCLRSIWAIEQPSPEEAEDEFSLPTSSGNLPSHRLVPLKLNDFEWSTALDFTLREHRVEWLGGPRECPARHHGYDPAQARRKAERSILQEACEFLRSLLAAGPVASTLVRQQADRAGLSWRTVQRAKGLLEVTSSMTWVGGDHLWNWWLPGTPTVCSPEQAIDDRKPEQPSESSPAPAAKPQRGVPRFRALVQRSGIDSPDVVSTAVFFEAIRQPGVPDMTDSEIVAALARMSVRVGTPPAPQPSQLRTFEWIRGMDGVESPATSESAGPQGIAGAASGSTTPPTTGPAAGSGPRPFAMPVTAASLAVATRTAGAASAGATSAGATSAGGAGQHALEPGAMRGQRLLSALTGGSAQAMALWAPTASGQTASAPTATAPAPVSAAPKAPASDSVARPSGNQVPATRPERPQPALTHLETSGQRGIDQRLAADNGSGGGATGLSGRVTASGESPGGTESSRQAAAAFRSGGASVAGREGVSGPAGGQPQGGGRNPAGSVTGPTAEDVTQESSGRRLSKEEKRRRHKNRKKLALTR